MRFEEHQKRWFTGRIGKEVLREPTPLTPASIRQTLQQRILIINEKSANAQYNYHKDYKINYSAL